MKVERFFHIRSGGPKGGYTIRVVGDTLYPGQVDIQVTKCSKRDVYCKRTGRAEAVKAPVKVIPLRYLPRNLWELQVTCSGWSHDFDYALHYFLPKE